MSGMKRIYVPRQIRRHRSTGQQPETKSGRRLTDKSLVNRLLTGQPLVNCSLCFSIPGPALHEKGLQRQQCVGPQVSSQDRRTLFISLANRTFGFSMDLYRISCVRSSEETFRTIVFDVLDCKRHGFLQVEPTRRRPSCPALPCLAAPQCAPATTRLWYVRVLDATGRFT